MKMAARGFVFTALCLAALLALLTLTAAAGGAAVLADAAVAIADPDIDPNLNEDFEAVEVISQYSSDLPAKSAILMEQETGKVLYEKNADEQIPPASVTKVMTLLLVMEAMDEGKIAISDLVTTSEYANSMGGSQIWLRVGEDMTVDDLLKAVAIASANDAAAALGEYVAGSNDAFVKRMNERAAELGMNNTHFVNATGLDDPGHLTTARDIAIMSRELIKYPKIVEYSTIWMDSLRGGATDLVNTNKLVRFYNGATGLKTGTTDGAGSCLAATATRDGLSLISVVMGAPSSNDRFASARGLLDFGFSNYQSAEPPPVDGELTPVPVLRGVSESVMPTYNDPGRFIIEKGGEDKITQQVTLAEDVEAPVLSGQILGEVQVMVDGEVVGAYHLTAANDVERMTFGRAFGKLLGHMLRTGRNGDANMEHGGDHTASPPATEGAVTPEHSPECTCEEGKCYCDEIGDICGCTKKE